MKNKKTIISFVFIISILVAISSIIGILSINSKNEYEITSIYGAIKIYGGGIYKHHTTEQVYSAIPHDMVSLIIALPALLISFFYTLKNSLKAKLFFLGVLCYILFTYSIYTFYAFYNALYICYVAIMGLSFYTLILMVMQTSFNDVKNMYKDNYPNKLVGGFLIFASGSFMFIWLKPIIDTLLTGYIPDLAHSTTLVPQAIDLAFFLPVVFVMGIKLWKKHEISYLVATIIPVFLTFMMTAVFSKALMLTITETVKAYEIMVIMGILALLSLSITILNYRYMKKI